MDKVMASELGYLGVNVDQNLDIPYVYLELEQRAVKGDKTALFKLHNVARHYEGDNKEQVVAFARQALVRLGEIEEVTPDDGDDDEDDTHS